MALEKTMDAPIGVTIENAYHRVESVELLDKETIQFRVRSYVGLGKPFFKEDVFSCNYDLNGENPIKQAYECIKKLEEFAGSIDC